MSIFTDTFFDVMNDDATLTVQLKSFNSRKAIFNYQPVPKGVKPPYIITTGEISNEGFDTKTSNGREIRRDIRCYAPADGDPDKVESIAERVRTLFHKVDISFVGFKTIDVSVFGPIVADEEDLYGRVLTVRCLLDAT